MNNKAISLGRNISLSFMSLPARFRGFALIIFLTIPSYSAASLEDEVRELCPTAVDVTIATQEETRDAFAPVRLGRPPHELFTRLRAESPVHRCEPPGFEPFWAITKYADIFEISTSPDRFASGPGIT